MQENFEAQLQQCIQTLKCLNENAGFLKEMSEEKRIELLKLAGQLTRPDRDVQKKRRQEQKNYIKQKIRNSEKKVRALTGIRKAREQAVFTAPEKLLEASTNKSVSINETDMNLNSPRNCYVCKSEFTKLHHFYDSMCPECAEFNYQKRFQTADLSSQVAIITGSRLKIGYYATLMLLRAGAEVVATTRFPHDSAIRFSKEKDFEVWKNRLHIYGLDLRHTPSVEIFCKYIETKFNRLDILINNAAQTVRRPPGFYSHLMEVESTATQDLPPEASYILKMYDECKNILNEHQQIRQQNNFIDSQALVSWNKLSTIPQSHVGIGITSSAKLSQIPYAFDRSEGLEEVFPSQKLDADLQQVDLRTTNSWRLKLDEVSTPEMLEVQLVNSVAPFVLCSRLAPLMKKDYTGQKHIVNVSAMEGKFYRFKKADRHPHTNMAKAALNMLTHTSASDLEKYGIFMNAVDTGWVTDEDPMHISLKKQEIHDFQPPLDIVDGAARVCDPFFDGINTKQHWCGKFLKDYKPIDW